jgi:hypothetical protein
LGKSRGEQESYGLHKKGRVKMDDLRKWNKLREGGRKNYRRLRKKLKRATPKAK